MGDDEDDRAAHDVSSNERAGDNEGGVDADDIDLRFTEQREFERAGLEECDGADGAEFGTGSSGSGDGCWGEVF